MDKVFLTSEKGYFGEGEFKFGGCFIPEILYPALHDLQKAYKQIFQTKGFKKELKYLLKTFVGRPTPLIYAKNASAILGNEIYLKFEGLANTGAHKINNALAQVLLAKRMKKRHIIAETGAGQHGVAVASVCAFLKMPCTIFMGATDIQRQRPNVFIMEQFGAEVVAVESGTKTLKDAVNEALRQWSNSPQEYFYVLGSALGPYPYPDIVRDSQSIIGKEIKKQIRKALSKYANTLLPDYLIACVGGGSNAMGAFSAFLDDKEVQLIGVEAGGDNFMTNKHAMRLSQDCGAKIGIAHGFRSYFLQDKHGQIANTHSISAGLDYAGVGPQLAHLAQVERVSFMGASDEMALEAFQFFASHEGILPALESSHALAGAMEISKFEKNKVIVVNVSGRGDKDIFITAKALCADRWRDFLESELQSVEKILKQKNKPKEVIEKEEAKEEEDKQRFAELRLALKDISHDEMSFFDYTNEKNSENEIDSIPNDNDAKEIIETKLDSETKNDTTQNIDTNETSATIHNDPLHFLTQDSNDMESRDTESSGDVTNIANREALHFLQDKELQNEELDNAKNTISQNLETKCEQKEAKDCINDINECVSEIAATSNQDSESMQDFSQDIDQPDTPCESISLESLLDSEEAIDKELQDNIETNISNIKNNKETDNLAKQLSLELKSLSEQESLQALQALETTQDSLNNANTADSNNKENDTQVLNNESPNNDVQEYMQEITESNTNLDNLESDNVDSSYDLNELQSSECKNENLDSINDLVETQDINSERLESKDDLNKEHVLETKDSLDSIDFIESSENLYKESLGVEDLESRELALDTILENADLENESLENTSLENEKLDSTEFIESKENLESKNELTLQKDLESTNNKDSVDNIENALETIEANIENGYSNYTDVSAFDDILGLQADNSTQVSDSLDIPDENEALENEFIAQDSALNGDNVLRDTMQDSISNDILQDTMVDSNIAILQEDLNDSLESEMPFNENTLQNSNILELEAENNHNDMPLDSMLDSSMENIDLMQDNSSATQEIEQDMESINTDLEDIKEQQDFANTQNLKPTLNYVAINPNAVRVFKTAPELSKICGKSLKS